MLDPVPAFKSPRHLPPVPLSPGEVESPGSPPLPPRIPSISLVHNISRRSSSNIGSPKSLSISSNGTPLNSPAAYSPSPAVFELDAELAPEHPLYQIVQRLQHIFEQLQQLNQEINGLKSSIDFYRNQIGADQNLDQQAEQRNELVNRKEKLQIEFEELRKKFSTLDAEHFSRWSSGKDLSGFQHYQSVVNLISQLFFTAIIPDLPSEYMQRKIDALQREKEALEKETAMHRRQLTQQLVKTSNDSCCIIL